jgi:hypothetical protein
VASFFALKLSLRYPANNPSYENLHRHTKIHTPDMHFMYKTAILLFKTNNNLSYDEWVQLNFAQINTSRQPSFIIILNKNSKIGNTILLDQFHCMNDMINLDWLSNSLEAFQIVCENKFLTFH